MIKRILILGVILTPILLFAQGSGTPSNIRVVTDANNYLLVTANSQTPPLSQPTIFSNTRVRTDSSNRLLVVCISGCADGAGTVTSIATTSPISGGVITTTGTISCPTCGVTGSPLSQFSSTTSAQFFATISNEMGSGLIVGNDSPTLVTPVLGIATATSINGLTISSTTGTFTLTNAKTLTILKSISLTAADDTGVYTLPTGTKTLLATDGSAASLTSFPTLNQNTSGTAAGLSATLVFGSGGTGLSTAVDDTTLISSGVAWVATAVTNCIDTDGNHLNYTAASNSFSCGTTSSGGGVTSLIATANQTTVSGATGDVTIGTVQSIGTGSTPQFARLGLGAAANATIPLEVTVGNNITALSILGGSITGSGTTPFTTLTGTWNTSGLVIAELHNITGTAYAVGSRLFEYQMDSASVISGRRKYNYGGVAGTSFNRDVIHITGQSGADQGPGIVLDSRGVGVGGGIAWVDTLTQAVSINRVGNSLVFLTDNTTTSRFAIGVSGSSGNGKITLYDTIATVSNGVPSELATIDLTGQTAAKTATALYTPTASGMFRVCAILHVTTVGDVSSILGGTTGIVLAYTEPDGSVAQSLTINLSDQSGATIIAANGNTLNTTQATSTGCSIIQVKTGVGITYAIGYTSVNAAIMQYSAHLKVEAM